MSVNRIYTCLHCGTQFVNLDGMLRCEHCGGRLAVMEDEELAPVGTGLSTELEALKTRWRRATTDESRRANDRRDVIAHTHNLSLEETIERNALTDSEYMTHQRRILKARTHNQNLAEAQRKQKAEGMEYTLKAFTKEYQHSLPRTSLRKFIPLVFIYGILLLGFFSTMGDYSMEEAPAIYVEVEVRLGGYYSPFGNPDDPVHNVDVMLYFANDTYAETIQTDFDGMGNSSIAYSIFTELYAVSWSGQNMGRFPVVPNNGEECCRVVLYFLG